MSRPGWLLPAVLVLLSCSDGGRKSDAGHCADLAADLAAGRLDPAPGTDQPGVHGCWDDGCVAPLP